MTTRAMRTADFSAIDVSTGIKVVYTQGKLADMKITAPRYIFDYLDVKVKNGTLNLSVKRSFWQNFHSQSEDITVTVSSPELVDLEASSGASIVVNGRLAVNSSVEVDASSGALVTITGGLHSQGKVELDTGSGSMISIKGLTANRLEADISSGSSMELLQTNVKRAEFDISSGATCSVSGNVDKLVVDASSGSSFKGVKFVARNADIDASSGASVHYNAIRANVDDDVTGSAVNHH